MRRIYFTVIIALSPMLLLGQYFLELHSEYDDSFREWEIILEQDSTEIEGTLELSWGIKNDFTQWQYRVGDLYGEINQKFNNNAGLWELRSEGKVVTMRQVWPGDKSEWKISYDGRTFVFRTSHPSRYDEWSFGDDKMGELILYTDIAMDPRDWIISDYTIEAITFEERMAAIFVGLYSSIPIR